MDDRPMTIIEHLEELRRRLLISFAALGIGGAVGWLFVDQVLDYVIHLVGVERVVFFAPAEALFIRLKIALFVGVFVAAPVVLYQLWAFIGIGLTHTERRTVLLLLPPSLVLFVLGAAFGLFAILPIGLKVLLSYQTATLQPLLAIGPTLSFVIAFVLAFGFVFQVPIIVLFLVRMGVVTPAGLAVSRRYALLVTVVVAALLTPGTDVVSQALMAVPTYLLYEISIWIARFVAPKPEAGWETVTD